MRLSYSHYDNRMGGVGSDQKRDWDLTMKVTEVKQNLQTEPWSIITTKMRPSSDLYYW